MAYIETDRPNYYLQKFGSLLFGSVFVFGGLFPLINGGTVTINDVPTKATLANTSPFLLIGAVFLTLFIWICLNYFRAGLTEDNVKKIRFNGNKNYSWTDFEEVSEITWLWKGTIYKFKPKNEKPFYVHSNRVRMAFNNPFKTGLNDMTYLRAKWAS